jgi:hypothetical protein
MGHALLCRIRAYGNAYRLRLESAHTNAVDLGRLRDAGLRRRPAFTAQLRRQPNKGPVWQHSKIGF